MATNPMQRKSRNSFLLGILITALIMGAIIAFLLWTLKSMKDKEDERIANMKEVYVLSTDVQSGQPINASLLTKVTAEKEAVPTNAITIAGLTENSVSKINLTKGTIITSEMIQDSEQITTDDLRIQEYNMLKLQSQIKTGDCIDIRLRLPSGLDYLVISKKYVEMPLIGGRESENTVWLKMNEADTIIMSEAIVEAYMMEGAVLYTTTYVEPGMQGAATATYVPNGNVQNLIYTEPNIVDEAKAALINRYNSNGNVREHINSELPTESDEIKGNVNTGVASEIRNAQEQRKAYLDSLAGN